jgi:hypothetical protein
MIVGSVRMRPRTGARLRRTQRALAMVDFGSNVEDVDEDEHEHTTRWREVGGVCKVAAD